MALSLHLVFKLAEWLFLSGFLREHGRLAEMVYERIVFVIDEPFAQRIFGVHIACVLPLCTLRADMADEFLLVHHPSFQFLIVRLWEYVALKFLELSMVDGFHQLVVPFQVGVDLDQKSIVYS